MLCQPVVTRMEPSKDRLFDAVIADRGDRTTDAVPFDVTDLAGWAVGLYDENLRRPDFVRLITWARLERRPAGLIFSDNVNHEPKLAAIARAQTAGRLRPGDPFDLMALVISMACAWSPASGIYTATADEPSADHDRRRALLRDCVERKLAKGSA